MVFLDENIFQNVLVIFIYSNTVFQFTNDQSYRWEVDINHQQIYSHFQLNRIVDTDRQVISLANAFVIKC